MRILSDSTLKKYGIFARAVRKWPAQILKQLLPKKDFELSKSHDPSNQEILTFNKVLSRTLFNRATILIQNS